MGKKKNNREALLSCQQFFRQNFSEIKVKKPKLFFQQVVVLSHHDRHQPGPAGDPHRQWSADYRSEHAAEPGRSGADPGRSGPCEPADPGAASVPGGRRSADYPDPERSTDPPDDGRSDPDLPTGPGRWSAATTGSAGSN